MKAIELSDFEALRRNFKLHESEGDCETREDFPDGTHKSGRLLMRRTFRSTIDRERETVVGRFP